jgi:prepilin-type N-terminal cleavage/methylation domain-containing protein
MKKNKKGFTLAELLIVVAIIAVLVAIAIPIFNNQLKKANDAVDAANVRSAYAEVVTKMLTENSTATTATINFKGDGSTDGWDGVEMAGLTLTTAMHPGQGTKTITFVIGADGKCTNITH